LRIRAKITHKLDDLQYDGLRSYVTRAGFDVVRDYCDVAVSGRREGRPQLNALTAVARNREIDCVLVWKFDRFASSTRHLLAALEEFDTSACASSASRIRSTPTAQWDGRCSPSSAPWPNWSHRSSASA
jgi:DNA invertase Pin-like site-specific DNA recombinase